MIHEGSVPRQDTGLEAEDLLAKHKDIVRLLKDGLSVPNTPKITGRGASTVQRVAMVAIKRAS